MQRLRASVDADLAAISEIYAAHVRHGTGSFEELPPTQIEMARRRADILAKDLPYLVVEIDGRVVGYAYASLYRPRSAYRFSVEDSIYVAPDAAGQGVGRLLLDALLVHCIAMGARQMVAIIGDSANQGSIKLHAKAGFRHVGTLEAIGFKFGRWIDSVIMQKTLGPGAATLPTERKT